MTSMAEGIGSSRLAPGLGRWRRHFELTWRLTLAALGRFSADRLFGLWWWVVDPLVMVGVYALVFSMFMDVIGREAAETYPLFLACGLIPWRWFTVTTTRGANAFLANSGLLISTCVSRGSVLLSELLASTLEAAIGVLVLLAFMLFYDAEITWNLLSLWAPLVVLGVLTTAVSFILCPLTVLVRDLGNMFVALLRAGWFLSPGLYSVDSVPEQYRTLYTALNPFVGIIEGIRRPIHDGLPPLWGALGWSALWAFGLLVISRRVFVRFRNEAVRLL